MVDKANKQHRYNKTEKQITFPCILLNYLKIFRINVVCLNEIIHRFIRILFFAWDLLFPIYLKMQQTLSANKHRNM